MNTALIAPLSPLTQASEQLNHSPRPTNVPDLYMSDTDLKCYKDH